MMVSFGFDLGSYGGQPWEKSHSSLTIPNNWNYGAAFCLIASILSFIALLGGSSWWRNLCQCLHILNKSWREASRTCFSATHWLSIMYLLTWQSHWNIEMFWSSDCRPGCQEAQDYLSFIYEKLDFFF